MKLSDSRNGFNVKVMCDGKIAHKETKCVYSKELKFVAVFANGLNDPRKGEISVMNSDKILYSGFKKSIAINTAPDEDMCTSIVIYYNDDNLNDIISLIGTSGSNSNYHRRLNTINKSLGELNQRFRGWSMIIGTAIIAIWLIQLASLFR